MLVLVLVGVMGTLFPDRTEKAIDAYVSAAYVRMPQIFLILVILSLCVWAINAVLSLLGLDRFW